MKTVAITKYPWCTVRITLTNGFEPNSWWYQRALQTFVGLSMNNEYQVAK